MYGVIILIMLIFQWNARSLVANRQDFKNFVNNRSEKPDVGCVQESGIKPSFSLVWESTGMGGGCVTFVKEGVPYAVVGKGREEEYVVCVVKV